MLLAAALDSARGARLTPALRGFSMVKRLVLSILMFAGTAIVLVGLFVSGALDRLGSPSGTAPDTAEAPAARQAATDVPDATGGLPPIGGTVANFTPFDPLRPAPEAPFGDDSGREVRLADFRGKVVLLNFWATWCVPCVTEMPALDRLQAALGDAGLEVVALSQDRGGVPAVVRFYEKYDFGNLAIYVDPKATVATGLKVGVLPTTMLIDREGRVVGELVGAAEWDAPEAQALIRHYLRPG
jgi:thiol-disulfide isomerase/thioredoxin